MSEPRLMHPRSLALVLASVVACGAANEPALDTTVQETEPLPGALAESMQEAPPDDVQSTPAPEQMPEPTPIAEALPALGVDVSLYVPADTAAVTLEWASGAGSAMTGGGLGLAQLVRELPDPGTARAFGDEIVLRGAGGEIDRARIAFRDCDRVVELGLDALAVRRVHAMRSYEYGGLSLDTHSLLGYLGCQFTVLPEGPPPVGEVFVDLMISGTTRPLAFRLAGAPLWPQSVYFSQSSVVWMVAMMAPASGVARALGQLELIDVQTGTSFGAVSARSIECDSAFANLPKGVRPVSVGLQVWVNASSNGARVELGSTTQCVRSDGTAIISTIDRFPTGP